MGSMIWAFPQEALNRDIAFSKEGLVKGSVILLHIARRRYLDLSEIAGLFDIRFLGGRLAVVLALNRMALLF